MGHQAIRHHTLPSMEGSEEARNRTTFLSYTVSETGLGSYPSRQDL